MDTQWAPKVSYAGERRISGSRATRRGERLGGRAGIGGACTVGASRSNCCCQACWGSGLTPWARTLARAEPSRPPVSPDKPAESASRSSRVRAAALFPHRRRTWQPHTRSPKLPGVLPAVETDHASSCTLKMLLHMLFRRRPAWPPDRGTPGITASQQCISGRIPSTREHAGVLAALSNTC